MTDTIIGVRDNEQSWEKQTVWKLDNGWQATEEWNATHGPFIKRLDKDGMVWLACNGKPENGRPGSTGRMAG